MRRKLRGNLEEVTGTTWLFAVMVVLVLIILGPLAVRFVINGLGSSTNTVSSGFSIPIAGGSFVS